VTCVGLVQRPSVTSRPPSITAKPFCLRGFQCTVAVTGVAEPRDLTRFEASRELMRHLGLTPWAYATGERHRQGGITKAGNTHARRALIEGAWAYRYPVKVSRHLQLRREQLPKPIPDISWKAHLWVCQRDRQVLARGKMRLRSSWPSSPQRQSRRKTAGGRHVPAASIQQGRQDTAPAANPADDPLRGGVCLLTTGAV
jgi:Transposase IS116/IS110/IS902 family